MKKKLLLSILSMFLSLGVYLHVSAEEEDNPGPKVIKIENNNTSNNSI